MNSHEQLCGLALAVNQVADHWTLLIVRELLPGPRRFSDLKASLRPIASNLLANRLKEMAAKGLIGMATLAEAPVAVYTLTARGRELRPVVDALIRWSAPEVLQHLQSGFRFEPRWLLVALPAFVSGWPWEGPGLKVRVEVEGLALVLELLPGGLAEARPAGSETGDVVVRGGYAPVLGLFSGHMNPEDPRAPQVEGGGPGWETLLNRRFSASSRSARW